MCPHIHCYLLASGDRPSYRVNLIGLKDMTELLGFPHQCSCPSLAHNLAHQVTEERGMLFF